MKNSSSTAPQWLLPSDSSVFPASSNSPLSVQAFDNLKEGKITTNWFWCKGKSASIPKTETISLAINIIAIMIESFHQEDDVLLHVTLMSPNVVYHPHGNRGTEIPSYSNLITSLVNAGARMLALINLIMKFGFLTSLLHCL